MNGNGQVEVHYIDSGFPYTVTQSFMDLFEGLSYAQADVALAEALQDQGNPYWSMMHTSSYKIRRRKEGLGQSCSIKQCRLTSTSFACRWGW